ADDKRLAFGDYKSVKVWDRATGRLLFTFRGHTAAINGVAFRPDGRRLASAGMDHTVKVWNAVQGQEQRILPGSFAMGVSFSPDSRLVATARSTVVEVWDAASDCKLDTLDVPGATAVACVSFSPDGKCLAAADRGKNVWLLELQKMKWVHVLRHGGEVRDLAYSIDGRRLVTAGADGLKVWDPATRQVVLHIPKAHGGSAIQVCYSHDGRLLASLGRHPKAFVKVWDAETGKLLHTFPEHPGITGCLGFSPDGKHLAAGGSFGGLVTVWSMSAGEKVAELRGHTAPVVGVAYSGD